MKIGDILKRRKSFPDQGATTPKRRILNAAWPLFWVRGDYTLHNSELLFAAVSRISNALSAMPVQLYRGSAAVKNSLNDLVGCAPNPSMTSCQFFKTMEACRCTYGNAYAIKGFDDNGVVDRIDPVDPSRVTPILDTDSGELWYRITPTNGNQYYLHNWYMLHIPFISTNGYEGVNPVSVLCNTLDYNAQIQQFSVNQLAKGVNASVVLEAPANLGVDQQKKMIGDFMSTYHETSGNILLLESGVTAKQLNLSPVDANAFEVEKITRSKVAMVYNLPPHLLGDYSDTSFSSQEQQMLEFLMLTMLPIVTAYEQELDRKILTDTQRRGRMGYRFNMDAILRADASTQAEVYQKAIRGGFMTPNEVRQHYNLASSAEGNKLLVARDLTTLEYIVNNPDKNTPG